LHPRNITDDSLYIVGLPEEIEFVLKEDSVIKYSDWIRINKHISIHTVRNGSSLSLKFRFKTGRNIHKEEINLTFFCQYFETKFIFNDQHEYLLPSFSTSQYGLIKVYKLFLFKFFNLIVYDTLQLNNKIVNVSVQFNLYYRNCISGEILRSFICDKCEGKTYSIYNNSMQCADCPL
jgi:hypothetical protein